jgi:hypothetical protein
MDRLLLLTFVIALAALSLGIVAVLKENPQYLDIHPHVKYHETINHVVSSTKLTAAGKGKLTDSTGSVYSADVDSVANYDSAEAVSKSIGDMWLVTGQGITNVDENGVYEVKADNVLELKHSYRSYVGDAGITEFYLKMSPFWVYTLVPHPGDANRAWKLINSITGEQVK